MAGLSPNLMVLVGSDYACVKITGRANFTCSPDFKTLLEELTQKGYRHFLIDLAGCALMDSTFLGVLALFGLKHALGPNTGIDLYNPNARVAELLENLGALHLFRVKSGELPLPGVLKTCTPESVNPTREEITRTSLEAHQTLMQVNPENVDRFKDVTKFLCEDLRNLEQRK